MSAIREKFIALCGDFQKDAVKGETDELRALLLEKVVLENEKCTLDMKINVLGNSTSAYVEETLEELHNSNSGIFPWKLLPDENILTVGEPFLDMVANIAALHCLQHLFLIILHQSQQCDLQSTEGPLKGG
ncbi:hypothetical protein ACLOJK_000510 [Asimina triloba]